MQIKEFKLRRNQLLTTLGTHSMAIIFAATKHADHYPYRQNSDFYYLTGFLEPEAIAILIPGCHQGEFILFNRAPDPLQELWEGPCSGPHGACRKFGATQAFAISKVNEILPQLITNCHTIYTNMDSAGNVDPRLPAWLNQAALPRYQINDLGPLVHEMRLKKSPTELQSLRQAIAITAAGQLRAMRQCQPKMYEFELEAEILYEFMRRGRYQPAFPTIVASGINACTLHYSTNNKPLKAGELVLIDAGAEYEHYCADISRTFPVTGKFTRHQQALYEIVLAAQTAVINHVRPGVRWDSLQTIAEQVITAGLLAEKLLRGDLTTLLAQQQFKPFFMHKVSHWLGLDVHDVGNYKVANQWQTLEPGMVLTVEPGLYNKAAHIGIRIEDDVVVTPQGCEVLTTEIPTSIKEIEKIMRK